MKSHHVLLACLLIGYVVITAAYSVINPLFEAPDEHYHYFTVQYIADNGTLPVAQTPDTAIFIEQEAAQPPLYYWLGSWLIRPIDTAGSQNQLWLNPRVVMGDASSPTNINRVVHDVESEAFLWQGYVLAGHVLRFFSLAFGVGTLLLIWASTQVMWPTARERGLFAVGIVAFLPQFNFLHSYINNDVAVIFFATLTVYLLLRLWKGVQSTYLNVIVIGVVVGLAMLSKTAGLLLLVYAVGFVLVAGWHQRRSVIETLLRGFALGSSALAVAGWLLWRNWTLYGDISAANQFVAIAGGDEGFTLGEILGQSGGIWRSLIAVFGWFNVVPPVWVYWLWGALVVIALLAAVGAVVQAKERSPLLIMLLFGWIAIVYAGMVAFMLRTPAAQGRLLLPAILPLVMPLALGMDYLWRRLGRPVVAVLAILPVVSVWCLLAVIRPIYAYPPTVETVPNDATALNAVVGDNLQLMASKLWITPYLPGDNVEMDLYWQADAPITERQEIVVELFGRNNTPIGKLQTYHGGGLYPSQLWEPNTIIHSSIAVELNDTVEAPTQARVNVRVVGAGDGVDIGFVEVEPREWPAEFANAPALAQIGDGIELVSAEINSQTASVGDTVTVDVVWRVTRAPNRSLTTLVHMGPPDQAPLANGDEVPLDGDYPTTLWSADEVIHDRYVLQIPAGISAEQYPVRIGMYDDAVVRVPLSVDGVNSADFTYTIGTITIE